MLSIRKTADGLTARSWPVLPWMVGAFMVIVSVVGWFYGVRQTVVACRRAPEGRGLCRWRTWSMTGKRAERIAVAKLHKVSHTESDLVWHTTEGKRTFVENHSLDEIDLMLAAARLNKFVIDKEEEVIRIDVGELSRGVFVGLFMFIGALFSLALFGGRLTEVLIDVKAGLLTITRRAWYRPPRVELKIPLSNLQYVQSEPGAGFAGSLRVFLRNGNWALIRLHLLASQRSRADLAAQCNAALAGLTAGAPGPLEPGQRFVWPAEQFEWRSAPVIRIVLVCVGAVLCAFTISELVGTEIRQGGLRGNAVQTKGRIVELIDDHSVDDPYWIAEFQDKKGDWFIARTDSCPKKSSGDCKAVTGTVVPVRYLASDPVVSRIGSDGQSVLMIVAFGGSLALLLFALGWLIVVSRRSAKESTEPK